MDLDAQAEVIDRRLHSFRLIPELDFEQRAELSPGLVGRPKIAGHVMFLDVFVAGFGDVLITLDLNSRPFSQVD